MLARCGSTAAPFAALGVTSVAEAPQRVSAAVAFAPVDPNKVRQNMEPPD
jgi:hypothetical protein